jgi:D-tyrosyl-tRNA(Tyr) deacylase
MLVISQFTLYASTNKGRRPTWDAAAPGDIAEPLFEAVAQKLRQLGTQVSQGKFGADMNVSLTNAGPMTLIVDVD